MADTTNETKSTPETSDTETKGTCNCGCSTDQKPKLDPKAEELQEIKDATIAAVIEGTVEGE